MDPHWLHPYHDPQQQQQPDHHLLLSTSPMQPLPPLPPPPPPPRPVPGKTPAGLDHQLRHFWENQREESEHTVDFKGHSLPLARIRRIMKSDEEVRMISAEAPLVLAKACEMFIQELTLRSWSCTEETKRRTLQKSDIAAALSTTDSFDFLVDIVPREKPLPLSGSATQTVSFLGEQQGDYGVGEGAAGFMMRVQQDDHQGFHSSGSECVHGGWPSLYNNNNNQPAYWSNSPMQRPPFEF